MSKTNDITSDKILSAAVYEDITSLKQLYKNIYKLEKLGEAGNDAALAIVVDLKEALNKIEDEDHKKAVELVLINNDLYKDAGKDLNLHRNTLTKYINEALEEIKKNLIEGFLYKEAK